MAKPLMCDPSLFERDLSGATYVVTGANSGIGWVTARQLAAQGARVVLGCRRMDQAQAAIDTIHEAHPDADLVAYRLDLGDFDSVRAFASDVLGACPRIDGLVNNAGIMNTPRGTTAQGFESQFGVNHLGHFLLTDLLLDRLKDSAPARIVCLSSCYHDQAMGRDGDIHLDDPNYETRPYDGWEAYAQSKLANLLHAKGLAARLEGTGVTAVSVHPGWVRTNLIRHSMPVWIQDWIVAPLMRRRGLIEPWEGTQTTLHALLDPSVPEHNGAFYSQTGIYRDKAAAKGGWPLRSPNPRAHDAALVDQLWDLSERLVGGAGAASA